MILRLPFAYARCRFPGASNDCYHYPRSNIVFNGSVWDRQRPYINQVIENLNRKRSAILIARPAYGKTTMSIAMSAAVGLITAILVHNTDQVKQWRKAYMERSSCTVWTVGYDKVVPDNIDVIVCLCTRVRKIDEGLRMKVGLLMIDEVHLFNARTRVEAILLFTPKYVFATTATFEKANGMHIAMQSILGLEQVDPKSIVPFAITKYITRFQSTRVKGSYGVDWTILNQSLLYNKDRNDMIVAMAKYLVEERGRKVLVFSTEVNHVMELVNMFKEAGIESCDYLAGKKSEYNNSQVLVGNIQKCGTGFDEEMHCEDFDGNRIDTLILASSLKNNALLYQVVGRTFRSNDPWVIHLVDDDPTIRRHWSKCHKWYRTHGGRVNEFKQPTDSATHHEMVKL
jgi:superfamily II DNA or RNA helicase